MSRTIWFVAVALAALLSTAACTEKKEMALKSTQAEFMRKMKETLSKSDIPYQIDAAGFIRFDAKDEVEVMRIKREVEQDISYGDPIRYDNKELAAYLKSLLSTQGINFKAEVREDGEWIRWHSTSLEQQMEIDKKLAEYAFNLKCKKASLLSAEEKKTSRKIP